MKKFMVEAGVVLHFLIGAGHLACLFCLETVFKVYGINDFMEKVAGHGAALPYLMTVAIAAAFFLAGCYGLSALGRIKRLPLQQAAIVTMLILFFGRAAAGIIILADNFTGLEVSSTCVSLLLGICYIPCLGPGRRQDKNR